MTGSKGLHILEHSLPEPCGEATRHHRTGLGTATMKEELSRGKASLVVCGNP